MLGDIITPDLFASALRMATPLALAAIGGTICERSGVVNIALEGIMLTGAFAGAAIALATGNPWVGVLAAVLAGVAIAAIHAFASINLRADQVVSGTGLNILALGLTGFLMERLYGHPGTTDPVKMIRPLFSLPKPPEGFAGEVLRWVEGVFLSHTPIVYAAILIAVVAQWAMYKTRWGLRLRALGEHPKAADTVGISVYRGRWVAVLMSGALAGLAGANLVIEQVGSFTENMTNGRGFIALAANIFGRWTPAGSYLASLLFGFADALQIKLQVFRGQIDIPPQFFLMLPYVLTVIVLAGVIGRAVGPAAVGQPYEKG
ncbi:MAG: ABC transporter permease [Anaerosomatales bacterium]|nr:ABC transporter permease [Anaerosomatales bacterium]MDI6844325.1 ABC transporter permease [Anaerosomatales bacterium]